MFSSPILQDQCFDEAGQETTAIIRRWKLKASLGIGSPIIVLPRIPGHIGGDGMCMAFGPSGSFVSVDFWQTMQATVPTDPKDKDVSLLMRSLDECGIIVKPMALEEFSWSQGFTRGLASSESLR